MRLIFVLLFLLTAPLFAQEEQEFIGVLRLNDSTIIPYEVNFKIDAGILEGYSLTDLGGAHETKSKLKGRYNPFEKEITFSEYDIIYTKSDVSQQDFCFVYFEPTRFKEGRTTNFSGPFKGLFSDGEECISGEIYLNSAEKIEKRMEKVTRLIDRSNKIPDSLKQKSKEMRFFDPSKNNILLKSQITSVFTKSNQIVFTIYDAGKEDGDVISIDVDHKRFLTKHEVTKKPFQLRIPFLNEKTLIKIVSVSTGSISTNTAVIEVGDGENDFKSVTNLSKGEETFIQLIRK